MLTRISVIYFIYEYFYRIYIITYKSVYMYKILSFKHINNNIMKMYIIQVVRELGNNTAVNDTVLKKPIISSGTIIDYSRIKALLEKNIRLFFRDYMLVYYFIRFIYN